MHAEELFGFGFGFFERAKCRAAVSAPGFWVPRAISSRRPDWRRVIFSIRDEARWAGRLVTVSPGRNPLSQHLLVIVDERMDPLICLFVDATASSAYVVR